ncbi:MAG: hypothetical protein KDA24_24370 [Deltaproteobacteria bacterium]|nr:hypothetical protein [Deltaproteobacteria bacterium]
MRWLLLLPLLLASLAHGAPFDLRALRAEHPGAGSVILEQTFTITQPDENTFRLAMHSRRAVLDDLGSEALSLFSQSSRPGCREPKGVRIEVTTGNDETLLTTSDDLVSLSGNDTLLLKGPRRGVATGALIEEAFHIDYPLACTGGLWTLQRRLGATVPVKRETVVVDCEDCAIATWGELPPFTESGDQRILSREDVLPVASEPLRAENPRPWLYVSTSDDRFAWATVLSDGLAEHQTRWSGEAGAWAKWARNEAEGTRDKTVALAEGLARVPVGAHDEAWKFGTRWGEPTAPESRRLLPLEWLAMASQVLASKGGVPVLLNDNRRPVPDGVPGIVDWDEFGVWLPDKGLVTTADWYPTHEGTSYKLADHSLLLLGDQPSIHTFSMTPEHRALRHDVTVTSSGIASLLLTVERRDASSWGEEQAQRWERRELSLKKAKKSVDEEARTFAGATFFDDRRLASTTIERLDSFGVRVNTLWTEKDVVRTGDGWRLIPIVAVGMPTWLRGVSDPRTSDIRLGVRRQGGSVTIVSPDGYAAAALPQDAQSDVGPVSWSAKWSRSGDSVVLHWELLVKESVVPASSAGALAAIAADIERTRRTRLVFEPR